MENIQQIQGDKELKAHIYQQLAFIEPYLIPSVNIAVSVDQNSKDESDEYTAHFTAYLGQEKIQIDATNENAFEALTQARAKFQDVLAEIRTQIMGAQERRSTIQSIKQNIKLH